MLRSTTSRTGDRIVRVERTDSSKTRAEKLRFAVTVEGSNGLNVRFYCAKAFLDGVAGTIASEARFYRDLAPRLSMRLPRVPYVAVDPDTDASIIVMEDIVANGGLFMNPHRPFPVAVTEGVSRNSPSSMGRRGTWPRSATSSGSAAAAPWSGACTTRRRCRCCSMTGERTASRPSCVAARPYSMRSRCTPAIP